MLSSVDRFIVELKARFEDLNGVHETFSIVQNYNLLQASEETLQQLVKNIATHKINSPKTCCKKFQD